MVHRAVLVDPDAQALDCARQSPHQLGRMQGRDVRRIDCAIRLGHADLLRQLLRAQPAVVAFVEALAVQLVQVLAQAGFLLGVAGGTVERATFAIIAVDVFTIDDVFHFIGNAMEQIVRGTTLLG
ncbi:hypothetical protein D3C76_1073230 [compost metagenome]